MRMRLHAYTPDFFNIEKPGVAWGRGYVRAPTRNPIYSPPPQHGHFQRTCINIGVARCISITIDRARMMLFRVTGDQLELQAKLFI